ncbi:MAG: hypothetical protein JWN76_656 [Chitinophagaceae bacterium]|nr:hypothetical protein [Chitinophagaceae bacterium]
MPTAGYSSTPLFKKLGLKPKMNVLFINAPEAYKEYISEIYNDVQISKQKKELDFVHLFTNKISEFERQLKQLKDAIKKDGTIWVSWYKKAAKKPTELTEDIIRDTALAIGLVDVKVCAVDEEWSGLKLVYRLKDR